MEGLVVVGAIVARKDGGLGVHDFVIFEVFDFFADFFIAVCVEDAAEDDTEADGNKNSGEDNFPGDVV